MDFEIKERNIFHDVMDRYQFIDGKKYLVPKFDAFPIKKKREGYTVTQITTKGVNHLYLTKEELDAWIEKNHDGLKERIHMKMVTIEKVNVFEADI